MCAANADVSIPVTTVYMGLFAAFLSLATCSYLGHNRAVFVCHREFNSRVKRVSNEVQRIAVGVDYVCCMHGVLPCYAAVKVYFSRQRSAIHSSDQ